jgi:hypothetical protein
MGHFEKLMKRMAEYYAREHGGIGWGWRAMDSMHCAAPLGGQKTDKNLTDRGKLGAKINLLLVDGRGAPISVVLTGANRHDKVSVMEISRSRGRSRASSSMSLLASLFAASIAPRTETTSRTDSILQVSPWLTHVLLLYNRDRCVKLLTDIRTMDPSLDLQTQRLFVATALTTQVLRNRSGLYSPPCPWSTTPGVGGAGRGACL